MNALEKKLNELDNSLLKKYQDSNNEVELLLGKYDQNFPTYTDHSIKHTENVMNITADLLSKEEIDNLNSDEIYILMMASLLHDIGMCLPVERIKEITLKKSEIHDSIDEIDEDYIRDVHHELSYDFIVKEFELLKIINLKYAEAIALVAMGHRKVPLDDDKLYPTKYFVRSGRDFVCLPYLASKLRLADELDITNIRTPKLLTKYYMPDNERSIKEWNKHISTTQMNYTEDKVIFEVTCSDQNNLAALEEQFEKIQKVINYCQKIIRTISNTEDRRFDLKILFVETKYNYIGFDPKGIKFSFDVHNVVKTFIGEDLYEGHLAALREVLQNSIDSCRYKLGKFKEGYFPQISIAINENSINIGDNGLGMDEFIIENFFGRLGSSFYEQEKVRNEFDAIGQFGVGVFSYFLLCDYIDIETKTQNGKALKFRIDNDPKNYFHFFDDAIRVEAGTTITLNLKEKIISKYSIDDFIRYIKNNFKYIDIPISIEFNDDKILIERNELKIDLEQEVTKRVNIQHKSKVKTFTSIDCEINNEDFEGFLSLLIPEFNDEYSLKELTYIFDYDTFLTIDHRQNNSQIAISQKGVFVNNYSSSFLSYVIGNINLKKGKRISISRRLFTDKDEIDEVIDLFSAMIIGKLFEEFRNRYSPEMIVKLSDEFLSSYISLYMYDNNKNEELSKILKSNIMVNSYEKGTKKR